MDNSQETTTINVIVLKDNVCESPGSVIHQNIMDHFGSNRFEQYGSNRTIDDQLLKDISGELTKHLRSEQSRSQTKLQQTVAAICVNVKGYQREDTNDGSNIVIFSVELHDKPLV